MTEVEFLERYHYDDVDDIIGSGGFGTVYKASDTKRNRIVAIKQATVHNHGFTLQKEVECSKEIGGHTNVLHYEDSVRTTPARGVTIDYAIMKYYEHGSLEDLLRKMPNMDLVEKKQIIDGIIDGIRHLHRENLIHRDLKTGNILMDKDGKWVPKIADFGLSRLMNTNDMSVSNSSIGLTMAYAAPEQIKGGKIKPNVDIWAIGVIIYRIIVGELPFKAKTETTGGQSANMEIVRQITNKIYPENLKTIPEPYQKTIRTCWEQDNNKRVQTIDDLLLIYNPAIGGPATDNTVVEPKKIDKIDKKNQIRLTVVEPEKVKEANPDDTVIILDKDETKVINEPSKKAFSLKLFLLSLMPQSKAVEVSKTKEDEAKTILISKPDWVDRFDYRWLFILLIPIFFNEISSWVRDMKRIRTHNENMELVKKDSISMYNIQLPINKDSIYYYEVRQKIVEDSLLSYNNKPKEAKGGTVTKKGPIGNNGNSGNGTDNLIGNSTSNTAIVTNRTNTITKLPQKPITPLQPTNSTQDNDDFKGSCDNGSPLALYKDGGNKGLNRHFEPGLSFSGCSNKSKALEININKDGFTESFKIINCEGCDAYKEKVANKIQTMSSFRVCMRNNAPAKSKVTITLTD